MLNEIELVKLIFHFSTKPLSAGEAPTGTN
jgi:hypothetical protein